MRGGRVPVPARVRVQNLMLAWLTQAERVPVPARVRVLVLVPGLDGDDISPDLPGVLVFVLVIGVQRVACTLRLPI